MDTKDIGNDLKNIHSLIRIINEKLNDVRAGDEQSWLLLNDIQNSMDVVEKLVSHTEEVLL